MTDSPLISVITVTYNAQKVIGKTLESIKSQSFTDYEHLVIDGASSDQTLSLVEEASMPRTICISEPDKGLYDAMNKGLKLAKGKYVLFLNAGDAFYDSDTLQKYAREAYRDADIIYGDTLIVNNQGEVTGERHLKAPEKLNENSFSKGMLICHQAFMAKKDLVPEYDLNYRFSADYDWCVRTINNSSSDKCVNLHTPSIRYLSDGLTDKNKMKSLKERFRIMARHFGYATTILRHIQFVGRALKRGKL